MALFDRGNDRGWRGDEHLRRDYGGDYREGMRGRPREGLWNNSWSDGAWTADAADRTERDWHLGSGGRYDRDLRMQGGTGMGRGMYGGTGNRGMDRDRGWNLGGGEWGHNWGSGNLGSGSAGAGYGAGGMDRDRDWSDRSAGRGGGFADRAQNAVRRGWDRVEERFDRDDDRMHMGGGAMRGGTGWGGGYDREYGMRGDSGVRGYRDEDGHYGVTGAHDASRGYGAAGTGGARRYGAEYDRGRMPGGERYDRELRGNRNWF